MKEAKRGSGSDSDDHSDSSSEPDDSDSPMKKKITKVNETISEASDGDDDDYGSEAE